MPVLYYVRHGLTDWNIQQRLQGRQDSTLTAEGVNQAERCADILRDLFERDGCRPDDFAYVSSPLGRARKTMELLRSALGIDPSRYAVDPRLAEIAFGAWEGLTYDDILARDAGIVAQRENNKWRFKSPGGESYEEVTVRVAGWHATVTTDTVAVAHGGTARALIAHCGIVPPEEATHYSIDQGVVYAFEASHISKYS